MLVEVAYAAYDCPKKFAPAAISATASKVRLSGYFGLSSHAPKREVNSGIFDQGAKITQIRKKIGAEKASDMNNKFLKLPYKAQLVKRIVENVFRVSITRRRGRTSSRYSRRRRHWKLFHWARCI